MSSDKPSTLWIFGPFLSVAFLGAVLYVKRPEFHRWVDGVAPVVPQTLAKYFPSSASPLAASSAPEVAIPAPSVSARTPADSGASRPSEKLDYSKIAAQRSLWPKSVMLRKPTEFPAVVNGKVVGKILAPKGSEANLIQMMNGKLGLEYQGGGAWVGPEETDVVQRAQTLNRG